MIEIISEFSIPLIIGVFCVLLGGYISIKIKYSESEEEAKKDLRRIFVKILTYLGLLVISYDLISQTLSNDPLTRPVVFKMIIDGSVILLWVISTFLERMFDVIRRIIDLQGDMVGLHHKHIDLAERNAQKSNVSDS